MPRSSDSTRIPFAVRLTAAFAVTLLVIGAIQYAYGAQQLSERVFEQTLAGYAGDAEVLAEIQGSAGHDGVLELLGHISHRPGVLASGLAEPDGTIVMAGADWHHSHTTHDAHGDDVGSVGDHEPAQDATGHDEPSETVVAVQAGEQVHGAAHTVVHEALGVGEPVFEVDDHGDRPVAVYGVPLELWDESYVLLVTTETTLVGGQLASLRSIQLVGLALAVGLGVPLFYLIGGRRLSAIVRHHQRRAHRDSLTDLKNHRAYQEELRDEVENAERKGEALTLMLLDLDGFKLVNDTLGHRRGDEMLAEVGASIAATRTDDLAFRIGGDEFAILLRDTDAAAARAVGKQVQSVIVRRLPELGVSIGMAEFDRDAHDADALLACADAALNRAKRRGRDLMVSFDELDQTEADGVLTKGSALRALLDEGEMSVAFQPVLDLEQGTVIGYEALARLPEVAGFTGGPGEAFETAERLGLVPELDALCRRAVLARADEIPDDTSLFLNIAPAALDHELLNWRQLAASVRSVGLTPERVVIELTERSHISASMFQREVAAAREMGFRIAVDDVGAGWTGFECLRAAEPDVIKVDRAIVANALTDTGARGTLLSVLVYAEVIGAEVIGEGVEDVETLQMLQGPLLAELANARITGVQGYLFGRPAPTPTEPERSAALPR